MFLVINLVLIITMAVVWVSCVKDHISHELNAPGVDMFTNDEVVQILRNKRVVIIGDSIQRSIYKDLVCLLAPGRKFTYLTSRDLKTKGELEFLGDRLLKGGQRGEMTNGVGYREVREYICGSTIIGFYFVTRCYSEYMESVLSELKTMEPRPHVIIMNSCLWDLHRYGPCGPQYYIINMWRLMCGLQRAITRDTLFIWNATLPLDSVYRGGFVLPCLGIYLSFAEVIEANLIARDVVLSHGFGFLDLYLFFANNLHLRESDGVHWNSLANRIISNHILRCLCKEWNSVNLRTLVPSQPDEHCLAPLCRSEMILVAIPHPHPAPYLHPALSAPISHHATHLPPAPYLHPVPHLPPAPYLPPSRSRSEMALGAIPHPHFAPTPPTPHPTPTSPLPHPAPSTPIPYFAPPAPTPITPHPAPTPPLPHPAPTPYLAPPSIYCSGMTLGGIPHPHPAPTLSHLHPAPTPYLAPPSIYCSEMTLGAIPQPHLAPTLSHLHPAPTLSRLHPAPTPYLAPPSIYCSGMTLGAIPNPPPAPPSPSRP